MIGPGDRLLVVDATPSTQELARTLAADGAANGLVVVAHSQTAGRGRRGRTFVSSPGAGLWMSMVWRLDVPMVHAARLPPLACLALVDILDERAGPAGSPVVVKWPNDLLVPHATLAPRLGPFRKVGGLLVEAVDVVAASGEPRLRCAILGLGLNLKPVPGGLPGDVAAIASDLHSAGLTGLDAVPLAAAVRDRLLSLDVADDAAFAAALVRLAQRSATLGREVDVDGVRGTAIGFSDTGGLQVQVDDGSVRLVWSGDVSQDPGSGS